MSKRIYFALLTIVFSSSSVYAGPTVARFSLDNVLKELGYSSYDTSAVPLRNEDDLDAGLLGVPNEVVRLSEFRWPFTEYAASSTLSLAAVGLDGLSFPKMKDASSTVAVVDLPNAREGQASLIHKFTLAAAAHVSGLKFYGDSLLRVESTFKPARDLMNFNYAMSYLFMHVETGHQFRIEDDLPFDDIETIRGYGDSLYVVAHGKDKASLRFVVVEYDPFARKAIVRKEVTSEKLGINLLHSPVDLPGRDVWIFGDRDLFVQISQHDGRNWVNWVLKQEGDEVFLGPGPHQRMFQDTTRIEGSRDLYQVANDRGVIIAKGDGRALRPVVENFGVNPYQFLRAVTAGVVGQTADHPNYQHYLYTLDGKTEVLMEDRLVKGDYKDGGFSGITNIDKRTGQIFIMRTIYDQESLSKIPTSQAHVCAQLIHSILKPRK